MQICVVTHPALRLDRVKCAKCEFVWVVHRWAPHVWQNQPVPWARLIDSEGKNPSPGQLGPW